MCQLPLIEQNSSELSATAPCTAAQSRGHFRVVLLHSFRPNSSTDRRRFSLSSGFAFGTTLRYSLNGFVLMFLES